MNQEIHSKMKEQIKEYDEIKQVIFVSVIIGLLLITGILSVGISSVLGSFAGWLALPILALGSMYLIFCLFAWIELISK